MDIELPFKCTLEDFKKIYQEEYIGKISHEFIRRELKLPDSVRVKLNGGFKRWLYLVDKKDCLYKFRYRIQTALWFTDKSGKGKYISIFPNFIRRWCQPCLNLFEHISCEVGKGEDVFKCRRYNLGTKPVVKLQNGGVKTKWYQALFRQRFQSYYCEPNWYKKTQAFKYYA